MSNDEKETILKNCLEYNKYIYRNPENYSKEHKRYMLAEETNEGKIIRYALLKYSPLSVLEIGPGDGFFTKLFLNHPSVREYTAIDIVRPFIEYIKNRVIPVLRKPQVNLICGDFMQHNFNKKFDLIVFIHSLHHIPNRAEFFRRCKFLLAEGGGIMFIEPSHSIPRVRQLIKKYFTIYFKNDFWRNGGNLSTHSFLTTLEAKYIAKKNNLSISEIFFFSLQKGDRYMRRVLRLKLGFLLNNRCPILPLFATRMYVRYENGN